MALRDRTDFDIGGNSSSGNPLLDQIKAIIEQNPYTNIQSLLTLLTNNQKDYLGNTGQWNEAWNYVNDYYTKLSNDIYSGLRNGSLSGNDALSQASQSGLSAALPGLSDTINNQISQDNASTAYNREIAARDTSLESTFNQLQNLGLNPGSAINIGGSQLGSVGQASNPGISAAQMAQQAKINEYNQKQHMTRQLISMAGSLAAAGMGGASYGLARGAAVKAANATVLSAKAALNGFRSNLKPPKPVDPKEWSDLMSQL